MREEPRDSPREPRMGRWKSGDQQYDCVASFSSVEHSGLGRYGDELNPFGDLQASALLA